MAKSSEHNKGVEKKWRSAMLSVREVQCVQELRPPDAAKKLGARTEASAKNQVLMGSRTKPVKCSGVREETVSKRAVCATRQKEEQSRTLY